MSDVEGIERIRYVTSHPRYMSLAVVEAVSRHKKLAKCFHIPFQAGDDEILHAMGRGHTVAQYLNIVDRIRALCPDAAITADVIVGFPGETEDVAALYHLTMKMLHSCEPNCAVQCNPETAKVRVTALRDIERGGKLTWDYTGGEASTTGCVETRRSLLRRRGFRLLHHAAPLVVACASGGGSACRGSRCRWLSDLLGWQRATGAAA